VPGVASRSDAAAPPGTDPTFIEHARSIATDEAAVIREQWGCVAIRATNRHLFNHFSWGFTGKPCGGADTGRPWPRHRRRVDRESGGPL